MPAARLTDMHVCPMVTGIVPHVGGPIVAPGAPTVLTGALPQARITDMCVCVGPPDMIVMGAFTVLVSGLPAARLGDMTVHGGVIVLGLPTVLIGDNGSGSAGQGGPVEMEAAGMNSAQSGSGSVEDTSMGLLTEGLYTPIPGLATAGAIGGAASQATALIAASDSHAPFVARCSR